MRGITTFTYYLITFHHSPTKDFYQTKVTDFNDFNFCYVTIINNPINNCEFYVNYSRADNARSLNDIEASLPTEMEAREAAVDEALVDRAGKFLSTHTVELSLPEEVSRSFDEGTFVHMYI